jgi:adenylosuccinate synthase
VYTTLKGWQESTEGITEFEKLPKAAQEYLRFQERESGAKIGMVSTGPDREQTMVLPEFAAALDEHSRIQLESRAWALTLQAGKKPNPWSALLFE